MMTDFILSPVAKIQLTLEQNLNPEKETLGSKKLLKVRNRQTKIKAEQHQLGNSEIFQNCVDWLPAGGVPGGSSSPTPRW